MCVLSFEKEGKQIKGKVGTFPINVKVFLCAFLCVLLCVCVCVCVCVCMCVSEGVCVCV